MRVSVNAFSILGSAVLLLLYLYNTLSLSHDLFPFNYIDIIFTMCVTIIINKKQTVNIIHWWRCLDKTVTGVHDVFKVQVHRSFDTVSGGSMGHQWPTKRSGTRDNTDLLTFPHTGTRDPWLRVGELVTRTLRLSRTNLLINCDLYAFNNTGGVGKLSDNGGQSLDSSGIRG